MKPRRMAIWGVTALGAFTVWRLREQGQMEDRFLEEGVEPDVAESAADLFIPFWSFVTYAEISGDMGAAGNDEWIAYAEESVEVIRLM